MANPIVGRLMSYFEIFMLFSISASLLPVTIIKHPLLLISSPSSFRSKWFEKLWNVIGAARAGMSVQSNDIDEVMSRAKGLVLEIGPGTGAQAHHFRPDQITKIYGVEPNEFLHEKLMKENKEHGLGNKYIPLLAAAEPSSLLPALQTQGLIPKGSTNIPDEGIFDSIVAVKVLCSVPQDQTAVTVWMFQKLLKPHGELLFFEHVENNTDTITQVLVSIFGWIWPYFTGGCSLKSKFDQAVLSMGGWSERRVQTIENFQGYEMIRYVKGVCVKE